jgi:hypothetical protein
VYRHFVELETVAQPVLYLVGNAVGTGHVLLSVYRDRELGEPPISCVA